MDGKKLSRRSLIAGAAVAGAGVLLDNLPIEAQQKTAAPRGQPTATSGAGRARRIRAKSPGAPTTAVGDRSPFFTPKRAPVGDITGTSLTPLQDLAGTITPSDLHFTRIHAGVPTIDPAKAHAAHPWHGRSSARVHRRRSQALSVLRRAWPSSNAPATDARPIARRSRR